MVQNYNSDTSKELITAGRLQTAAQAVPMKIADTIVPVIECNPKMLRRLNIVKSNTASDATGAAIMTTSASMDFYISAIELSYTKDANATSILSTISAYINGASSTIAVLRYEPLTAGNASIALSFPFPIKIDRNTAINVTNSTNVASIDTTAIIYGYYDEISNA